MDDARSFQVLVLPAGVRFEARADRSLLASALAALTPLRSSCRNGTCRACLCHLDQGEIVYEIDWPGVSADERREGWILPCVARPASDLVLDTRQA